MLHVLTTLSILTPFVFIDTEEQARNRFQSELEFVQCLANPNYLNCKYGMSCTPGYFSVAFSLLMFLHILIIVLFIALINIVILALIKAATVLCYVRNRRCSWGWTFGQLVNWLECIFNICWIIFVYRTHKGAFLLQVVTNNSVFMTSLLRFRTYPARASAHIPFSRQKGECDLMVLARKVASCISETGDLEFHTTQSLMFTQHGGTSKRKSGSVWHFSITKTLLSVKSQPKTSQKAEHVRPWGGWATSAKDFIRFRSCQARTGTWGYSVNRLAKTGLLRIGTNFSWFEEFHFLIIGT